MCHQYPVKNLLNVTVNDNDGHFIGWVVIKVCFQFFLQVMSFDQDVIIAADIFKVTGSNRFNDLVYSVNNVIKSQFYLPPDSYSNTLCSAYIYFTHLDVRLFVQLKMNFCLTAGRLCAESLSYCRIDQ